MVVFLRKKITEAGVWILSAVDWPSPYPVGGVSNIYNFCFLHVTGLAHDGWQENYIRQLCYEYRRELGCPIDER